MSRKWLSLFKISLHSYHFLKGRGGGGGGACRQWKTQIASVSEMLKWKRRRNAVRPFLRMWLAPASLLWEAKLGWDNLESEPLSMHWGSEVSFGLQSVQTWLSLQVWKSFASSFLHEVDELIRSLCCWLSKHSEAVCVAGTSSKGAPKISISILFSLWRSSANFVMLHTHKAGGYISRLIYSFYFGLEKLSQLG